MNSLEILNVLKKYNFNTNDFIILSGASLVMHGLKENTNDIDISCTDDMYDFLKNTYDVVLEKVDESGKSIYFIDSIINFGTTYSNVDFHIIDGYKCQTLKSIKNLKIHLGRKKDFDDIKLIDDFLNSSTIL